MPFKHYLRESAAKRFRIFKHALDHIVACAINVDSAFDGYSARRILRWRLQNIFGSKWKCLFLSTDYFINATSLITLVVLGKMVHEKRDDS